MASDGPEDLSTARQHEPPALGANSHTEGLFSGWELPEQLDFLRNRLLLAGLGVLGVLLLTTIVLVILGGAADGDDDASASAVTTPEDVESTPDPDFSGRIITTATMRIGPGIGYAIMGTVPEGALVAVVGRNEDNTWLQLVYPPGSQLRGWVPAEHVDLTGDIEELAVEGAGEAPDVEIPTDIPYVEPWTSTPVPFEPPPQNTQPPRPTRPQVVPTNTPAAPPTNTPAPATNTPPGQGQGAAVTR